MKGQNLITFQSTNYDSSPEGEVFPVNTEGCSTAHNWWSVEYKTAASGILLNSSIKEKCEGLGSRGLL